MSKYIVKNCPSYDKDEQKGYTCTTLSVKSAECKNCTDCLIKQVIEKCRNYDKAILKDLMLFKSVRVIVRDILKLFEIEECE